MLENTASAGLVFTPFRVRFHSDQAGAGALAISMKASAAGTVNVNTGSYCRSIEN